MTVLVGKQGPGKSKIANFHGAVAIEQKIGRFQIPVNNFCGMKEFNSFGELVKNEAVVRIF